MSQSTAWTQAEIRALLGAELCHLQWIPDSQFSACVQVQDVRRAACANHMATFTPNVLEHVGTTLVLQGCHTVAFVALPRAIRSIKPDAAFAAS